MSNRMLMIQMLATLFVAGLLASSPALAGKPSWAGKGGKGHKIKVDDDAVVEMRYEKRYFGERERVRIRDYYRAAYTGGFCPPGLAKKHNGCMPPGQAKKRWQVGHRLPSDVVYYELPDRLVIDLGRPPLGHKFVRVASDILMIAVGTGLVVDAIDDLSTL